MIVFSLRGGNERTRNGKNAKGALQSGFQPRGFSPKKKSPSVGSRRGVVVQPVSRRTIVSGDGGDVLFFLFLEMSSHFFLTGLLLMNTSASARDMLLPVDAGTAAAVG